MQLLEKPRHRFVLWAAILIAVAAAVGVARWRNGLAWWIVLVCVFGVWIVLIALERRIERRPAPEQGERQAEAPAPPLEPDEAPPAPPVPTLPPEPARRRRFLPSTPSASATLAAPAPAATALVPRPQKQWSIWTLDRVARETTNAELRYLVLSLQEYADADGMLPLQFDPLVRETFGELLGANA